MRDWLKKLKVGDSVIVAGGGVLGRTSVQKVVRFTKTQIVLDSTLKFNREFGRIVGENFYTVYLHEATVDAVNEIKQAKRRRAIVRKLREMDWQSMGDEKLYEIYQILHK